VTSLLRLASMTVLSVLVLAVPALAQEGQQALINLTGSFGAGLIIIGAAYGIGRLASASFEGMARQPEVANTIRGAMILAAALIEGATFFALIVCIVVG